MTDNNEPTRPKHYKGRDGKDLFDFFESFLPVAWVIGFYVLNVIKYVVRHENKNGVEDLEKASVYLNKLIGFKKRKASK